MVSVSLSTKVDDDDAAAAAADGPSRLVLISRSRYEFKWVASREWCFLSLDHPSPELSSIVIRRERDDTEKYGSRFRVKISANSINFEKKLSTAPTSSSFSAAVAAASSAVFPAPAPSSPPPPPPPPRTADKKTFCPQPTRVRVVGASVASVRASLINGDFSCLDLVESYSKRIESLDSGLLRAVRRGRALGSALEEARAVDKLIEGARKREERGRQLLLLRGDDGTLPLNSSFSVSSTLPPLLCVPFLIKDNIDVRGTVTSAGSVALLSLKSGGGTGSHHDGSGNETGGSGDGEEDDASPVASLRRAGAVILAKSNMAEWALSPVSTVSSVAALDEIEGKQGERRREGAAAAPDAAAAAEGRAAPSKGGPSGSPRSSPSASPRRSRHLGAVRNPHDLSRSPAGSSGGSAAGVAASLALASLGTDTGNSVRGPAAAVGIVGFRPSLGLVSRRGVVPLDSTADTVGPMAGSVADVAAMLDALVSGTAAEEEERKREEGARGERSSSSSSSPSPSPSPSSSGKKKNRDFSVSWSAIPPSARLPGIHAAAAERGGSSKDLRGIRLGVLDCALSPRGTAENGDHDETVSSSSSSSSSSSRLDVLRLFNSSMLALEAAGATVLRGFSIKGNSLGDEDWGCVPGAWPTGRRGGDRGGKGGKKEPLEEGGDSRRLEPLACRGRFAADSEPYFAPFSAAEGGKGRGDEEEGFVRSVWESGRFHPAARGPLRSHFEDGEGGAAVPRPLRLLPERDRGGVCGCGALWDGDDGGGDRDGKAAAAPDPCKVEFRKRLIRSMDFEGIDAVAFPTWTLPPRLLSEDDDFSDAEVESAVLLPQSSGGGGGRASAAAGGRSPPSLSDSGNLSPLLSPPTGAPAVSLPMGFTEAPSTGLLLPAGLQLVGRPFADAELVRVAAAVERALVEKEEGRSGSSGGGRGLRLPPPLFAECG